MIMVKINTHKNKIILNKTEIFLNNPQPKISDLVSVIGTLVFLFPDMSFDKLYYRNLEKEKILSVLKGK